MLPESRTKKGTSVSSGSNKMSPGSTFRNLPPGRRRAICAGVKNGKAWVRASSALGTGQGNVDMIFFRQFDWTSRVVDDPERRWGSAGEQHSHSKFVLPHSAGVNRNLPIKPPAPGPRGTFSSQESSGRRRAREGPVARLEKAAPSASEPAL